MSDIIIVSIGYLASLLLAISLLVNNDLKFRWLNTFGCIAFIVYGVLIHAFPILLTNFILLLINVFYLIKIYRTHEHIDLIECKGSEHLVKKFLSFYQADIKTYFPSFEFSTDNDQISFVVVRDMVMANIFVARLQADGAAIVEINYTVPKYRDYKVGKFIFDRENHYLISKGIRQLVYTEVFNLQHERFIKVMGFKEETYGGKKALVMHLE